MREGKGKEDTLYRPSRKEVLAYVNEMAQHELINVRTSTGYVSHVGSGGCYAVITTQGRLTVRAVVFAPGAHETTAGAPHWPIDPSCITNGAHILHSSGVNEAGASFYSAVKKYVIGASKIVSAVFVHV